MKPTAQEVTGILHRMLRRMTDQELDALADEVATEVESRQWRARWAAHQRIQRVNPSGTFRLEDGALRYTFPREA